MTSGYAGHVHRSGGRPASHRIGDPSMRFLPDRAGLTIAVVGFGYVGSCLAATLADRGHDVIGIDRDAKLIEELTLGYCRIQEPGLAEAIARGTQSGRLRLTTDAAAVADADVVLIAVGTPIRPDGSLSDEQ